VASVAADNTPHPSEHSLEEMEEYPEVIGSCSGPVVEGKDPVLYKDGGACKNPFLIYNGT
jgi:hypothetical protein